MVTEQLFLIAQIAGRTVAIASDGVESVVDIEHVVPVPRADTRVRGLAALRSRVVTVLDARVALGVAPGKKPARRAVVIGHEGHSYGVLVDGLDDVAPYVASPVTAGLGLDGVWGSLGRGLIDRDGETLLVVDLSRLVPDGGSPPDRQLN